MENRSERSENFADKEIHALRSLAEAHLFVAVAKADGVVSTRESNQAGYLAQKAQKRFDFLGSNDRIPELIRNDIKTLLLDSQYKQWSRGQHADAAIQLLKQALICGDWAVKLTPDKLEPALLEVAFMDGYDINESQFVKEILTRLRGLLTDNKK